MRTHLSFKRADSSVIAGGEWRSQGGRMILDFTSGKSYEYAGVPEEIAIGLVAASSVGAFYNAEIKGKFDAGEVAPNA